MIDKDLLRLLGDKKKYIVYTVISMVIGLCANLGITMCICQAIRLMLEHAAPGDYVPTLLIGIAALVIRYVCTRCTARLKDSIGREVKRDLRASTYNKIICLGMKSTSEMSMAGLTQVSMEGIEQLDLYFSNYIPQFFYAMLAPVILFIVTVRLDAKVAIVLLCCVPLIPVSIIAVSKWAKKIFAKYWDKYTAMGDYFLDSVQGLKELKIFKADARQHEKMNQNAEEFREITMKVLTMQLASTTIMDLVAYGGAGAGIAFAVRDLADGRITVMSAVFLMLVAVDFFLPLRAFGSAFHVAMNGVSAGKKIISLLEMEEPRWGSESVTGNEVVLDHVSFSYDGKREVLKDVNMTFPEKGMTAIVGESGCGKSTIVGLMNENLIPQKGSVSVGNTKLGQLSRADYYSHLATDEQMEAALKKVNLWKFIEENGGLDKSISEDAANISGGQKQRLALAVNLVADKDIYIFDEATSNIDIESEEIIMKNIKALSKEKNVIVISHRLENIVPADRIYYLESGKVKECGNHQSLMEAKGGYAVLYRRQKELEKGYVEVSA